MTVTADVAGRAHRALEPLHSHTYFVPETEQSLTAIGLRPGRMCYFAGRSASMGAVGPGVVAATFYNFNPGLVQRFIPRAWTLATPAAVVAARFEAVDASLRRLLGDDTVASAEVAELADLTRAAAAGARIEGRPLYAGHADLEWPTEPHLVLWHAVTLLRENRGDGHLMALARADLAGIEALITHCATGRGFTVSAAKQLRGWSDEQWADSEATLRDRGVVTAEGQLTAAGAAMRAQIEAETDELALGPWQQLGATATARAIELGKPLSVRIMQAGVFGSDVFAAPRR